jgi:hypothetical protein
MCRVPVVLQPQCFHPPTTASTTLNKTKREAVVREDDPWTELEADDWGEAGEADCAPGHQFPDLSWAALQRLPQLLQILAGEPFSINLGRNETCSVLLIQLLR